MTRKLIAGIAIGLTAALITLALSWAGFLEETELVTYDWRIRRAADPASIRDDIVIIEVNDTSIATWRPSSADGPGPARYSGRSSTT